MGDIFWTSSRTGVMWGNVFYRSIYTFGTRLRGGQENKKMITG
jgi:hypothetical protein